MVRHEKVLPGHENYKKVLPAMGAVKLPPLIMACSSINIFVKVEAVGT